MLYAVIAVFLLALMLLPKWWVGHVMQRHGRLRKDFPGNGSDMAHHLLGLMDMKDVKVEVTDHGDHYDPSSRTVRLTRDNFEKKSLTGVVVAAHEVGHAIQHHRNEGLFNLRTGLAVMTMIFNKAAPILLLATPLLVWLNPAFSRWSMIAAVVSMLLGVILNLVTLPVEWDASFGKAMPMLENGDYLGPEDMQSARQLLKAAALTYVASSLASLLNLGVLARVLRR